MGCTCRKPKSTTCRRGAWLPEPCCTLIYRPISCPWVLGQVPPLHKARHHPPHSALLCTLGQHSWLIISCLLPRLNHKSNHIHCCQLCTEPRVPPQNSTASTANTMRQPQQTHDSLWVPKEEELSPAKYVRQGVRIPESPSFIHNTEHNSPGKSDPSQLMESGLRSAAQAKWERERHPVPLHAAPGPELVACDVTLLTVPTGQPQLALYGKAKTKNKQTESHPNERFCFPGRELNCSS